MPTPDCRPDRSVALIGFMGAGKSTIGRILARRLGLPFVDLDDRVVEAAGMPITEIFRARGEQAFRETESACLQAIVAKAERVVLATGGGAPIRAENQPLFRSSFATYYLDVSFRVLAERTAGDAARPLRTPSLEELRTLYEARVPVYAEVGERISADGRTPEEIAQLIVERLRRTPAASPDQGVL